MKLKIRSQKIRLILILILICGLLTLGPGLLYGQDDYLNVKGNTKADTVIFVGNLTAYPVAPLEGEVFYNTQDKLPKYFDGTVWRNFGGPKTVATRIVAALDTPNGASRADYTCDGTDDQHEINQAINALPSPPSAMGEGNGVVYLLEGTYNISAVVSPGETLVGIVPHTNTALIGTGRGTVLKVAASADFNVINASSVTGILISQLMIDGNKGTVTGSNNGIYFDTVTNSKIDKVWVENMRSQGIYLKASSQNTIPNNYVAGSGGNGIYLEVSSANNTISHNYTESNGAYGIHIASPNCNYNIVSHNDVENNDYGIRIGTSSNNIVSHNNIHHNTRVGISLNTGPGNIISNNNIHHNTGVNTGVGIDLVNTCARTIISNNNINNNRRQGITATASASNSIITGNVIYDNGGVDDNSAIQLSSSYNIISSNRLYDSAGTGYGINILADCTGNYLVANLIDGTTGTNPTGYYNPLATPPYDHRIQDLGTGTKYTDKAKITLERNVNTCSTLPLNVTNPPQTYVALNPAVDTTLSFAENGSSVAPAAGALLILENVSTSTTIKVTINDNPGGNVNLGATRELYQYDTLKLIWNGSRWLEIGYVKNSP